MPDPILTAVVCTHNRPTDLARCLKALAGLRPQVDVVVVDSASDPPCAKVVESSAASLARLKYVYEPSPGLSRARNAGLRAATTELVAFVDDDAVVAADWGRLIVTPFTDETVACVGGSCVPAFAAARPGWLSDRLLQYAGITRFRTAGEARDTRDYPFGANVAFRREPLLRVGGFPERLGRTAQTLLSGEESYAIDRLRESGLRVWLEPSAVVAHTVAPDRCTSAYYWRRLWWQGVTRARATPSPRLTLRLLAALPLRLVLWVITRDRVHLYRAAETTGYVHELLAR